MAKKIVEQSRNLTKAIELIKNYEGCKLVSYLCPAGKWTIGYGSTFYPSGNNVKEGDKVSEGYALVLLKYHCENTSQRITDLCHPTELSNNQLCALVSFVYNIGIGNFKESTLLKLILKNKLLLAAAEFPKWNKSKGKVLKGLTTRRAEERELFLTQDEALVNFT